MAIAPLQPVVTGNVANWAIAPALPSGLSMNSSGVISGTPNAVAAATSHVITASNAGGSTTTSVSITVNAQPQPPPPAAPSGLAYSGARTFVVGEAITPLNPTVTGSVIAYSVSPALPTGLALATVTGIISGTPTQATAQATYRITASNAGGSTFHDLVIEILAPQPEPEPEFLVGGIVTGLSGDSLVLRLNGAEELTRTANGLFLFSTTLRNGATYLIEVTSNPMGPVQTCQVGNPTGQIAGADVTNVIVTCEIVRYEVGAIVTGLKGTGLRLSDLYWDVEVPITGNGYTSIYFAAVNAVYDFALDAEPTGPDQFCTVRNGYGAVVDGPKTIQVDCRDKPAPGRFAYVLNYGSATISGFAIDQQTGQLAPMPGSPFPTAAEPIEIVTLPDGRFLYVRSDTTESIAAYAIDPLTGALSPVPGSPFESLNPFSAPSSDFTTVVHPSGGFMYRYGRVGLYVGVLGYAIDEQTGALTLLPGSPFPAGYPALFQGDPAGEMRIHPDGRYLHFSQDDGTGKASIATFSINQATGTLARTGTGLDVPAIPDDIILDPLGRFMYAFFYQTGEIMAARLDPDDGSITPITGGFGSTYNGSPWRGLVDPSGRFLVVATDHGQYAGMNMFNIDQDQGHLNAASMVALTEADSFGVGRPLLHGDGRFLYQSMWDSNQIGVAEVRSMFDLESLRVPGRSPVNTLAGPTPAAIDGSGRWLLVAGWDSGLLIAYRIDPATGELALVPGGPVAAGTNPYEVVVVP